VRCLERVAELDPDAEQALGRECPVLRTHAVQCASGEQLHDQIDEAVLGLTELVDRDGVGLRQAARERRFAHEPVRRALVSDDGRVQELDRHPPAHGMLQRPVDHAHAARADALLERVAAGDLAAEQRIAGRPQAHELGTIVGAALQGPDMGSLAARAMATLRDLGPPARHRRHYAGVLGSRPWSRPPSAPCARSP
jgi:hypothetical protein